MSKPWTSSALMADSTAECWWRRRMNSGSDSIALFAFESLPLRTRVEDQLSRLQEYRQALITAAVTGQLDIAAS